MSTNCLKCKSKKVSESVEGHRLTYNCHDCDHTFDVDSIADDTIKTINTSQGTKHIETAAIIRYHGKILLVEQDQYPNKLELPVSHLRKNESLEHALERTIRDILGLEVTASTLLDQFEQPLVRCRYGADSEEWAVFNVEISENDLVSSNPTRAIVWMPVDAIDSSCLCPETIFALTTLGYMRATKGQDRRK